MPTDLQKYIDIVIELAINYIPQVLLAWVTFFIGLFIIRRIVNILDKAFKHKNLDVSLAGFLHNFLSIALKILLFITVAGMVGVQMTSFIAILWAAGLAIWLALQGSLANFAWGVLILFFKPFNVGDYIVTWMWEWYVQQIQIFNTILKTRDDRYIILPNGELSNGAIDNYSSLEKRRVDVDIGVAYWADIDIVKDILLDILHEHKDIPQDPNPQVLVHELADSAVVMRCRFWALTPKSFRIRYDINEQAKKRFDAANIEIPFPQQDVHHYYADKWPEWAPKEVEI